jgi:hypothetical protein
MSQHVYLLQTKTEAATCILVFRTLSGVYSYLQSDTPFEFYIVPFDVACNDIAERRALHEIKPYKVAWNADKTWSATVTRQEILEDFIHPVSTMHSFHLHHNTLFDLHKGK